jgi:hypothetical protein
VDNDKGKKQALDEKALAEGLTRVMPPPPGQRAGRGDWLGPRRSGAESMWARVIMTEADANKDGKVSLEELLAAAERAFRNADKDKDGMLTEWEITEAMNRLPAPPARQ